VFVTSTPRRGRVEIEMIHADAGDVAGSSASTAPHLRSM
jgi:hypothetical protein